jgi:hypothetical protein
MSVKYVGILPKCLNRVGTMGKTKYELSLHEAMTTPALLSSTLLRLVCIYR